MVLADNIPIAAPLIGGLLIGGAAAALLVLAGQIAGVSGVLGSAVDGNLGEKLWRPAFLLGLILAGPVYLLWRNSLPDLEISASTPTLIIAGLLVGFGTRVGNGCTSGHGVCGMANLSPRSLVATLTFMGVAIIVVFLVRHGGLS